MRLVLILTPLLVLVSSACRGEEDGEQSSMRTSMGSPDALCVEHGVAEAVCTKCNPKLAPIFQEKGDWCAEHGLPESFCPTCHPERGGKPAADLSVDTAPLDGTAVVLRTPEAVRAAGIESVEAEAPSADATLSVLATITYDALRRAEVNPRLKGIVREVLVDVGTRVKKGDPLFRIESAELAQELSKLSAARSRLAVAEAARERIEKLLETGMAARKNLLEVQLEIDSAQAEIAATSAALGLVGVEEGALSHYTLLAPLDGAVLRMSAAAGRMVDADEVLCEIVDTTWMWAELDVPEAALSRIAVGQEVRVRVDSLGEREFEGKIDYVAPEVDPRTRTTMVRVRLANPDGVLRANMFARATIALGPSSARALVPREALQRAADVQLVFVQLAADRYEARRVQVGERRGEQVEIVSGIEPGELVATRGSFLLKTETLKGSIGAGCCEVE